MTLDATKLPKHPCCLTCKAWEPLPLAAGKVTPHVGTCRRNAPTAEHRESYGFWPKTQYNDYCFEHLEYPPAMSEMHRADEIKQKPQKPLDGGIALELV